MLLVGDIGGTNTRLALFASDAKTVLRMEVLPSGAHKTFAGAVDAFLGAGNAKHPRLTGAAFGIAGPVIGGRVKATNLPWVVDEKVLARHLGLRTVSLVNDLVALGLGAIGASRRDLHLLQGTRPPGRGPGTVAIIAAGTGLGEAALVWDGARLVPCGSEGGHVDFAPRNAVECDLRDFVAARIGGRVSYERVLSGPGLGVLYDFFREVRHVGERREDSQTIAASGDRNAAIATLGASRESAACAAAVDLFVSLYGAEAGNLALKYLAVGGVFLAGKIAESLTPALDTGFLPSFLDKGRMRPVLERIPVAIVKSSVIGLYGAARIAAAVPKRAGARQGTEQA